MSEDWSEIEVELLFWDRGREDPKESVGVLRSGDEVGWLDGDSNVLLVGVDGSTIIGFALGPSDAIVRDYSQVSLYKWTVCCWWLEMIYFSDTLKQRCLTL